MILNSNKSTKKKPKVNIKRAIKVLSTHYENIKLIIINTINKESLLLSLALPIKKGFVLK